MNKLNLLMRTRKTLFLESLKKKQNRYKEPKNKLSLIVTPQNKKRYQNRKKGLFII